MRVQVREKPAAGSIIGMRDIVSSDRTLTRHLTDSGHWIYLQSEMATPALVRSRGS
ncbi:hypothetical protein BN874_600011 [Candidatus Contendobacter odensis Run_B_J11]|uniref:Uncharacterized protein n=1 Tax=Candidatus Contendobacter odensis Run_B_J11 TaxID=1400861 RepID=A0A7U7GEH3_9GAMM|nr:hypothetical protein BN874_600011 [Candidatus Contendobacter odensis Run_B_J11]